MLDNLKTLSDSAFQPLYVITLKMCNSCSLIDMKFLLR